MFLKTKYSKAHQKMPDEFATLMIKKANAGNITDWEFSIMNVHDGKRITPTNIRGCMNCHENFSSRGYISRESETALKTHLGWIK